MTTSCLRKASVISAQAGYTIRFITRDLHPSEVTDNIMTEHEKMFSDEGIPIKYLEATV